MAFSTPVNAGDDSNPASEVLQDLDALKTDRASWERQWQQIADLMCPRRADFETKYSSGLARRAKIFDSTAVRALTRFSAGLHNLLTPAAAPWFILKPSIKQLEQDRQVQLWLEEVTRALQVHFSSPKSNFHPAAYEYFTDLGAFGTGSMYIEDAPGIGPYFRSFPLAKTCYSVNKRGRIDSAYREYTYTAKALVENFDTQRIPESVLKKLENGKPFEKFDCVHVIKPWHALKLGGPLQLIPKPFISIHILKEKNEILGIGGHDEFPYVVSRWAKNEDEIYGRGPGGDALPDVLMSNEMEKTYLKALQKQVDPPLTLPDDGFLGQIKTYPGAINIHRVGYSQKEIIGQLPMGDPRYAEGKMSQVRDAINKSFYLDLIELPGPVAPDGDVLRFTATEIATRQRDRLAIIGPIVARQEAEFLSPLIERTFRVMARAGMLPPPPPVMEDMDVQVSYVNPVSVAQRTLELNAIGQLIQFHMPLAQIDPTTIKRLNVSRISELSAEILNVPPSSVFSDEEMAKIQEQEQQAQQAQQQMQAESQMADTEEKRSSAQLNVARAEAA
jgi:hypothetical protein